MPVTLSAADSSVKASTVGPAPEMTAGTYLEHLGSLRGLERRGRRERVAAMVEACGLAPVLDRQIGQLSRGYRQRVGIAATLLHEPDLLILDEPTSGLDPNQIVEVRSLIRRIAERKTVILSSHILPEVESTCSRVLILAAGTLRADGLKGSFEEHRVNDDPHVGMFKRN